MDIETYLLNDKTRAKWPRHWAAIEVYSSELVIYTKGDESPDDTSADFFSRTFNSSYDREENVIRLMHHDIDIIFNVDSDDESQQKQKPLPLFSTALSYTADFKEEMDDLPDLPIPIIAFHSYKGGVGRTLSALALVRELSKGKENQLKSLLIDADIEAPGLTWMNSNSSSQISPKLSYLDILTILHDCPASGDDAQSSIEKAAIGIADLVSRMTIHIPTEDIITDHFFIPAYREEAQLLGQYANPADIVSMPGRSFVISDFLSRIGNKLGVDVIVIDLRAGISNLSAPFLFDPRVRRVFVTSTSDQSIKGTELLLKNILRSPFSPCKNDDSIISPTIMLTMIPTTFDQASTWEVHEKLYRIFPDSDPADGIENQDQEISDIIIDVSFSERLIHLGDITDICAKIKGSSLEEATSILQRRLLPDVLSRGKIRVTENETRLGTLADINAFARGAITAEGPTPLHDMLMTSSLSNLAQDFRKSLPKIVVLGQKGSGKTYLYRQLLGSKYWDGFTASLLNTKESLNNRILLAPLLASENRKELQGLLETCFSDIQSTLGYTLRPDILQNNKQQIERKTVTSSEDWGRVAAESFCDPSAVGSLAELDRHLGGLGKQMVLLVDGLDDIFNDSIDTNESRSTLKTLCQDFINHLAMFKNIGIIVFARTDMLQDSISTNFAQFKNQYERYELKWSQLEALRLAVWILSRVGLQNFTDKKSIIARMTHEAATLALESFWGKKLGSDKSNNAFTSRWVLAALSDFNGLLQARDIIRLLKYATDNPQQSDSINDGRYLMPADIQKAIVPCSVGKYDEIKAEMKRLAAVLKKLDGVEESDKVLPLLPSMISAEEKEILEKHGYLKQYEGYYYLPEIIRHAIGYRYKTRGRARVLSFLAPTSK